MGHNIIHVRSRPVLSNPELSSPPSHTPHTRHFSPSRSDVFQSKFLTNQTFVCFQVFFVENRIFAVSAALSFSIPVHLSRCFSCGIAVHSACAPTCAPSPTCDLHPTGVNACDGRFFFETKCDRTFARHELFAAFCEWNGCCSDETCCEYVKDTDAVFLSTLRPLEPLLCCRSDFPTCSWSCSSRGFITSLPFSCTSCYRPHHVTARTPRFRLVSFFRNWCWG